MNTHHSTQVNNITQLNLYTYYYCSYTYYLLIIYAYIYIDHLQYKSALLRQTNKLNKNLEII